MKQILFKISEIQKGLDPISKNAENPFYSSSYADLPNIQESLQGLLEASKVMVYHQVLDSKLITTIFDLESSESLSSEIALTMTDPQKKGSEITYFRRYNLLCLFDLRVSDDDANSTSNNAPKQQDKPKVDVWLSDKVFESVMNMPKEKIAECLNKYNGKPFTDGKTYAMKKEFRTQLENKIK